MCQYCEWWWEKCALKCDIVLWVVNKKLKKYMVSCTINFTQPFSQVFLKKKCVTSKISTLRASARARSSSRELVRPRGAVWRSPRKSWKRDYGGTMRKIFFFLSLSWWLQHQLGLKTFFRSQKTFGFLFLKRSQEAEVEKPWEKKETNEQQLEKDMVWVGYMGLLPLKDELKVAA